MNQTLLKASTALLFLLISSSALLAQSDADFMRSMGKIYVVVAVIVVIFLGIVVYLVSLDRKLTKLENQIRTHD
ncbi:MAG: hypothetical protein KatS3mg029_0838 [Saprospiraceae bacterium]|nr:MAG: hypothetical protein KatS3mg029_0838 [Saprospiraceae bacterium]